MKSVLVLDACQRSALAVTRSLGNHNVSVITADSTENALAGQSKYSLRYISYPDPQIQSDDFIQAIIKICSQYNIDILFPMTELTVLLLIDNQQLLTNAKLPFATSQSIETLSNKISLMKLADSLSIPFPQTWFCDSASSLQVPLNRLPYPLVLKPGKSWLIFKDNWIHTAVRFATDESQAAAILSDDPAFSAHPFMLQQTVPGRGAGVFALYDHGKAIAFFAHRRIREKPPCGGVSVVCESQAVNPQLQHYAKVLLDEVNWHGIAMVEFRVDKKGHAWLMEINTRFWGSLQLSIDAGVDFPWLLYQLTCGNKIAPIKNYKTGKRLRWTLGDVDSLYLVLRDTRFSLKEKVKAILDFLTPHPFKTRHEVNRITDIKPFIWEIKQYIKDLIR